MDWTNGKRSFHDIKEGTDGAYGGEQNVELEHSKQISSPCSNMDAPKKQIFGEYQKIQQELLHEKYLSILSLRGCHPYRSLFAHLNQIKSDCKVRLLDISENKQPIIFRDIAVFMEQYEVASLRVSDCGLDEAKLGEIRHSFLNLKFDTMDASFNTDIGNGFSQLGAIVCQCNVQKLDISDCGLSTQRLEILQDSLGEHKMKSLDISYNVNICEKGYEVLSRMIHACNIEKLTLCGSEITREKIATFNGTSQQQGTKFSVLDVSYNRTIEHGFANLGETVRACNVEELEVVQTELNETHLKQFTKNLGDHKLKRIDLSFNTEINEKGFEVIAKMIHKSGIKQISLRGCQITEKEIEVLEKDLIRSGTKFWCIDISHNACISAEGFKMLASIIGACSIEKISLRGCDITSEKIEALYSKLKNLAKSHKVKIKVLNLSENESLASAIADVASMSADFSVEELYISRCALKAEHLDIIASKIHKLKILDISEPNWTPNEEYLSVVETLIGKTEEKLILCFNKIDHAYRKKLEKRAATNQNLQICFDHSG